MIPVDPAEGNGGFAAKSLAPPLAAAQVESVNVVGYSSLTFKEGWNLVGVQFEGIGGGTVDVQDLFSDVSLAGLDDDGNLADFMYVWDNETGFYSTTLYWSDNALFELEKTWITGDFEPAEYAFKPGDALWVYTSVGGTAAGAVTAGQVGGVDKPIEIATGWNLIANPFPTPLEINGGTLAVNGLTGLDDDGNLADFMYVWNNASGFYETTLYWSNNALFELENVWITGDFEPAEGVSVAPNTAFWVYHSGAGAELTFSTPL
jgi:hypothetical protein